MSNPIDRGFYCSTEDSTEKSYRMANGVWVRRYETATTNELHIVLHEESEVKGKLKDCTMCKHKFLCLVSPECHETFESK